MPRTPSQGKTRLNLELSEDARSRLERLRVKTDADSMAEVIRRALAVYEFLTDRKADGAELVTRKDGDERPVVLL